MSRCLNSQQQYLCPAGSLRWHQNKGTVRRTSESRGNQEERGCPPHLAVCVHLNQRRQRIQELLRRLLRKKVAVFVGTLPSAVARHHAKFDKPKAPQAAHSFSRVSPCVCRRRLQPASRRDSVSGLFMPAPLRTRSCGRFQLAMLTAFLSQCLTSTRPVSQRDSSAAAAAAVSDRQRARMAAPSAVRACPHAASSLR